MYRIGKYEIAIPDGCRLPEFQRAFKLYDRFLPVLAKHVNSDKLIVDVGANIGDTATAVLQVCQNPIVCIEPSDTYFAYLDFNIRANFVESLSRIALVKRLIGTGHFSGQLSHEERGTASLKVEEAMGVSNHLRLDSLLKDTSSVILLKVDTDGFDFDVLQSAERILTDSEPLLFWENEVSADFQMDGFNNLYRMLEQRGYQYICIFDNFGNIISDNASFTTLSHLAAYTYSMKAYNCTRTIYYTDVLAATGKYYRPFSDAIADYRREWIKRL